MRPDLVKKARGVAARVEKAIWEWGVEERKGWGTVFAYEVDGFGGRVFVSVRLFRSSFSSLTDQLIASTLQMDDANVPSLLSLPYLGFLGEFVAKIDARRDGLVLTPFHSLSSQTLPIRSTKTLERCS